MATALISDKSKRPSDIPIHTPQVIHQRWSYKKRRTWKYQNSGNLSSDYTSIATFEDNADYCRPSLAPSDLPFTCINLEEATQNLIISHIHVSVAPLPPRNLHCPVRWSPRSRSGTTLSLFHLENWSPKGNCRITPNTHRPRNRGSWSSDKSTPFTRKCVPVAWAAAPPALTTLTWPKL